MFSSCNYGKKIYVGGCILHAMLSITCCCLCKSHCERVTQFWTSSSEEEKKEERKHYGHLVTFWFSTFVMLFHTTVAGCVVCHENTRR